MKQTGLRFITFGISHFCEKARWALDWHGVQYSEVGCAPGLHRLIVRRLGAADTTLPILLDGTDLIQGSGAIIDWAEKHCRDAGRSLAPDDSDAAEAEEIERRADEVIGPHVRRLIYAETLPTRPDVVKPALFLSTSVTHRVIGGLMWPVTRKIMMSMYDVRQAPPLKVKRRSRPSLTGLIEGSPTGAPIWSAIGPAAPTSPSPACSRRSRGRRRCPSIARSIPSMHSQRSRSVGRSGAR